MVIKQTMILKNLNMPAEKIPAKYIVLGCAFASFCISFYYSGVSLWADELFSVAKTNPSISLYEVIKGASLYDSWPPLYYILLHYMQIAFGNAEQTVRLISIAANVLCIPAVYLLSLKLYSKKEALLSCIFFSLSPFALSYSVEARGYSLFLLFSVYSMYFLIKFIDENKNNKITLLSYFIFALLCSLTHYFGLILVIFQLIYLYKFNAKKNYFFYFSAAIFLCLLFIYPALHFDKLYFKQQIFQHNAIFASDTLNRNFFIVKELLPDLLNSFEMQILFYFALVYHIFKIKNKSNIYVMFFMLMPVFFVNLYAYLFMSFLHSRYFIFLLPLVYIMTAHFLCDILKKYYPVALLFVISITAVQFIEFKNFKISYDDRNNVIFIKNNLLQPDTFVAHSKSYYIDYYFKKFDCKIKRITFFKISELKKTVTILLNSKKDVYVLYPFKPGRADMPVDFNFIKINDKLYKLEAKTDKKELS